jgi:hypothetical protein
LNLAIFKGPVANGLHLDLLDTLVDAVKSLCNLVEKWLGGAQNGAIPQLAKLQLKSNQ